MKEYLDQVGRIYLACFLSGLIYGSLIVWLLQTGVLPMATFLLGAYAAGLLLITVPDENYIKLFNLGCTLVSFLYIIGSFMGR